MSVFLIVLISVLLFIPGTLQPFTQGEQEDIVTANRVGDQLSEGLLGDPAHPHILNASCTRAFFRNTTPSHGECRFSGETVQQRVGTKDRQFLNITLRANINGSEGETILCWGQTASTDAGERELVERVDATNCETVYAIGSNPDDSSSATVTARRVVTINESTASTDKTDVALVVEVW